jgi:hypothetical protein
MPAASTHKLSVQVSDFEDICPLIQLARLICDFCSSGQRFACGFLQIPPRDGHPCRLANDSPCRVRRRLSLPSKSALPGAQTKRPRLAEVATGFLQTLGGVSGASKFTHAQVSPGRSSRERSPHTGAIIIVMLACHDSWRTDRQTIGAA